MVAVLPEEEEYRIIADIGYLISDLNPQSAIRNPKSEISNLVSLKYQIRNGKIYRPKVKNSKEIR